jgi:hypothetical protein
VSSLDTRERTYVFRYRSAEDFVDFFRTNYGPTLKAFAALDEAGRERFHEDLVSLVRAHDRLEDGPIAVPATYLEAVAIRRWSGLRTQPCTWSVDTGGDHQRRERVASLVERDRLYLDEVGLAPFRPRTGHEPRIRDGVHRLGHARTR